MTRPGRRAVDRPGAVLAGSVRRVTTGDSAAEVQRADLRVLEHFLPAARQPDLAVFQHHAVGGQPQPGPRVLLHQQDRLALRVHHPDGVEHRLEHPGRQSHGRLVQDHQLRVEHETAGEFDQPLLPAGQAARLLVQPLVDLREHLLHRGKTPLGQAALPQGVAAEADVLAHRHLTEQAVVLRYLDHAAAEDLTWRLAGQPLAVQRDLAEPRPEQPADSGEQGRFPGSVRSHHAGDPALHDLQGYPTQDIAAAVGVEHPAVVTDLCWRPGDHRVPVVEDGHLVAQAHHELHVVLHDEERGPLPVQLADALRDGADQGRVHPAGWLIEQDDLRLGDQHVGQFKEFALAVGQRLGAVPGQLDDAGELEQLHRPLAGGGAARPGERVVQPPGLPGPLLVVRGHDHVLHDRQPGEDPGQLEGPADSPRENLVRGQAGDLGFIEVDVAAVHPPVAGDHVEQGGLPGAIRPDQPGDAAALDLDRAVAERLHTPERLRDALGPEQRRHDALLVVGLAGLPAAVAPTGGPGGGPATRSAAWRCLLAWMAVSFSPTVGRIPRGRKMITTRNSAPRTTWATYVLVTCCWAQPR